MTYAQALAEGRRSRYARAVGGFVIAEMPDGEYDWFPVGQPPHRVEGGQIIRQGEIMAMCAWTGTRWWSVEQSEE